MNYAVRACILGLAWCLGVAKVEKPAGAGQPYRP